MDTSLEGFHAWAAWMVLAFAIAVAGAYVAFDLAKRLQTTRPRVARLWLAGAALGLGTGLWSAQILAVAAVPLAFTIGYHPWLAFAAWGLAVGVGGVALALAGAHVVTPLRGVLGAATLGLGVPLVQMLVLGSLGLRPGVEWHWAQLALAPAAAGLGSAAALGLFFKASAGTDRSAVLRHVAAALLLGAAIVLGQYLALAAAGLDRQTLSAYEPLVPSAVLTVLASVGSLVLLATMLAGSVLEARMRASLRSAKHDLRKLALSDPLTGLPNRVVFEGALAQAVQAADAKGGRLALLFIDLDGFKPVNESFGHHNGDLMLREAAARLRALAGPHDRLARLGADEFLILRTANPGIDDAAQLAGELLERLSQPCKLDGRDAVITASIGIAMYPEHGAMSTLIAHADAAMRASKGTGGATYSFFEARMVSGAREQTDLLRDLRLALAKGQLELYYQPKIHAPSGEITGAEALMRWHHPQRGMVSPTVFIPIAERYGLIHSLGNWVIEEACRQARIWRDEGLRMRVAINLSVHQLRQPDLAERIAGALARNQIKPQLLTCEITESVAMEDAQGTMKIFESLAAVGVHISIDDFGTGYSSLAYLRKLPAEELKIDRSFVLDLESSADARAVVDAVVKLAQALGLKVVAEGVETEAQNQILRSLGCDELQGFLFAKPMSAKALAVWAMDDEGPRTMAFRASLFKDTAPMPAH